MNIKVNGEELETKDEQSVSGLLLQIGLDEEKIMACAINGAIVKKDAWNTHILRKDDALELLNFVGGG